MCYSSHGLHNPHALGTRDRPFSGWSDYVGVSLPSSQNSCNQMHASSSGEGEWDRWVRAWESGSSDPHVWLSLLFDFWNMESYHYQSHRIKWPNVFKYLSQSLTHHSCSVNACSLLFLILHIVNRYLLFKWMKYPLWALILILCPVLIYFQNSVTWNIGAFNLKKQNKTKTTATYPFNTPEGCENWPSLS